MTIPFHLNELVSCAAYESEPLSGKAPMRLQGQEPEYSILKYIWEIPIIKDNENF
jgi:hypothetical protein